MTPQSTTAYHELVARFHDLHERLRREVLPRVAQLHHTIDADPLLFPVRGLLHDRLTAAQQRLSTVDERLTQAGRILPERDAMLAAAEIWIQLRDQISGTAALLAEPNIEIKLSWQGRAAQVYDGTVRPAQAAAAQRLGVLADAFQQALSDGARALYLLTVALAVLVVGFVGSLVVGLAGAAPLVVGLAAGAAAASTVTLLTFAGLFLLQVVAAINNYANASGQTATAIEALRSQLHDNAVFPRGAWPDARTAYYADATVTDGDADWSVVPRD